MARRISFALTIDAFLDGTKTVTRRTGWRFLTRRPPHRLQQGDGVQEGRAGHHRC